MICLIDIDDTLADTAHRQHLIEEGGWDAFHGASRDDPPIPATIALLDALAASYHIVALTARPEKWRTLTMTWLVRHNVSVHELLMRPDADFRPAALVKPDVAITRYGSPEALQTAVSFVIDEREDVLAAFVALGIPGFRVHR